MNTHKSLSFILFFILLFSGFQTALSAFDAEHKLVIQINERDPDLHDHVLSNIVNLQKFYGIDQIQIEVVAYGQGIWMLTADSPVKSRIEALQMQEVVFTACTNTLDTIERDKGKRPALLEGVEQAQAGIARIIELQETGYAYLSP